MVFICVILNTAKKSGWLAGDDEWNSMSPKHHWYEAPDYQKGWIASTFVTVMPRGKTLSGKRCIPNRNALRQKPIDEQNTGVRRMNMTVISSGLNWISISKI